MKFSIFRDQIYEALQKAATVIPQRSTIAMTQNILLSASSGTLNLTATDLEITINSWVDANVVEEGTLAVPGKLLHDTIRELPNVELTFESDENFRLKFYSEFGEYKIAGENPSQFFKVPEIGEMKEVQIENKILKKLIENTIFSCSADELRPALTGVYFELGNGEIKAVATDGHRLATMSYKGVETSEQLITAIISTRALNYVLRNLDTEGSTALQLGKSHALFQLNQTQLFARLIDEVFVDYQRVIPAETNYELKVPTDEFYASVKRVSLFSNPISAQIILRIFPTEMELHAEDIDYGGEAREKISCDFTGDEFLVGFNSRYLQDILRHVETSEVLMQFVRPDYAVLVRPVDLPENEDQLMLLMPVRLDSD